MNRRMNELAPPTGKLMEAAKPYDVDIEEACKALKEILERRKTCEMHIWASHTASSSSR